MKARESGMPDEAMWSGFFDPAAILARLGLEAGCGDIAEIGCGYGTFTLPAARLARGIVHAFDIEPEMVAATGAKATAAGANNVRPTLRDVLETGTGLPDGSVDYVMLFNILHAERPQALLLEAARILRPGGRAGIIHWRYDPSTPRGPSMEIRPRPEQCRDWAIAAGFDPLPPGVVDLPPYHWGLAVRKALAPPAAAL